MSATKPTIDLVRQEVVRQAKTIVIKLGTHVVTGPDGMLDRAHLAHLIEQISEVRSSGRRIVLVSSGAIGAGLGRLGKRRRPTELPELQAAAAIGQCDLMRTYDELFRPHGCHVAQVLLTAQDLEDRTRYLNVRNTLLQLLHWNALPIINENDTVSVAEIRFGDNDQLAAMVTNLLQAPLLVILSVVDGLYEGDFRNRPDLEPIDMIMDCNDAILALAGGSTSELGTGGMRSKLQAARMVAVAGESVWIANGKRPDVLRRLVRGERFGTLIPAKGGALAARKRWLGYTKRPRGGFVVDDGAQAAVCRNGKSLLPIGVVAVHGEFGPGDLVVLENRAGVQFARGLSNYSAAEARKIIGHSSREIAHLLPGSRYDEVVHRDNLVLLE